MLKELKRELAQLVAQAIKERFGVDHEPSVEIPPRRELGDLSFPAALKLARELKKNPRAIGQELAEGLEWPDPIRSQSIEGAGFLNLYLDRSQVASRLVASHEAAVAETEGVPDEVESAQDETLGKVIVEHTNINPNKAAHIGHLRNAILGDVLGRLLRHLGYPVEIQNYIDDTGVQLADVVVGFMDLRNTSLADVAAIPEPFDYVCWDLYSEVGQWYEEDESRRELRKQTLHALEADEGERAEMGRLVARRVVQRHLTTMARLGIDYDVLTHESDILGHDFFAQAFEALKESGAIRLEDDGKNAGCWVMPLSQSAEFAGLEDPDKVIVRSDGTVTYVGKDIAYQLWKFGLLGRDFAYRFWMDEGVWVTTAEGAQNHPEFGGAERVINVIDNRQSYLQKIVKAGLQALGHENEAERSIHFAYEMVSLSAATAQALGYLDDGDEGKSLEMSGRKGIGVKADDLLDQLEAKAREEIEQRDRELSADVLDDLSRQIATAAIRFHMVKATTTRVIAFDLDEALSFEGETGPYLQYSMVRVGNILNRLRDAGLTTELPADEIASISEDLWQDDLWDLVWTASQVDLVVEKAAETLELSLVARLTLDMAQKFNAVYHKHPILHEENADLRTVRLATFQIFRQTMVKLMDLLGIPNPGQM